MKINNGCKCLKIGVGRMGVIEKEEKKAKAKLITWFVLMAYVYDVKFLVITSLLIIVTNSRVALNNIIVLVIIY